MPPESPFVRARIIGGLALLALVIVLGLIDALRTDFTIDTVQFGLLLGTSLAMLGLDVGRRLLG
ncbi:MAG TPA: hypothetical protein VN773_09975 [Verrucomicrobiae bacterium]|nr:hypothetical protein [Verrucomicrobiae bacterium]